MQVMRDVKTKDIKPKDIKVIEDKAAHQDAAVDKVSAKAHLSMWVELSPVSPHPKDDYSHLQYREGGFPKDIPEDIKAAQRGPQHLYKADIKADQHGHQHFHQRYLLSQAEHREGSQDHQRIVTQPVAKEQPKSSNSHFPM